MSDTPQEIVDDIVLQCQVIGESESFSERTEARGKIDKFPARIQDLIDAAREEGRKEGLAIAHATEQRLAKVREKGGRDGLVQRGRRGGTQEAWSGH